MLRAAVLFGQTLAAVLAQVLVSVFGWSYLELNYFSFASVCVAVLIAVSLMFFNMENQRRQTNENNVFLDASNNSLFDSNESNNDGDDALIDLANPPGEEYQLISSAKISKSRRLLNFLKSLWNTIRDCYGNKYMRRWCVWWILATCGDFQVENYMSTLWEEISPAQGSSDVYNGGVTACATLMGLAVALILGRLKIDWSRNGELLLAFLSFLDCGALYLASITTNLWIAYGMYVFFAVVYTVLITIVSAEVARHTSGQNYAFLFGFNMFLALSLQTILTSIVNNETWNLDARTQFVVYSAFFGAIGVIFLFFIVYSRLSRK